MKLYWTKSEDLSTLQEYHHEVEPKIHREDEPVDFKTSKYGYTGPVVEISGPVEYYIASMILVEERNKAGWMCVDAGGRNFGVDGSVYVKMEDLRAEIEKWRPGFWVQVEHAYGKYKMNPEDLKPLIWERLGFEEHEDIPRELRILVCGQVEFTIADPIERFLLDLGALVGNGRTIKIIHGAAPGADTVGAEIAKRLFGPDNVLSFPAAWNLHGKKAGMLRNVQMIQQEPHLVAAFYVKEGPLFSRGTNMMVKIAGDRNTPVLKYEDKVGWY